MANAVYGKEHLEGNFQSFSGADMKVVIEGLECGSLQAFSYSATREKGPIYVMDGSPDPKAFARGKRAIAGSLVFLTLDEQAFLKHMRESNTKNLFHANPSDINYSVGNKDLADLFSRQNANFNNLATANGNNLADAMGQKNDNLSKIQRVETEAWYADQILPFDVNIAGSNERGIGMSKVFYGCEIMNEGGGVSVDDLVIEESYTFVCRGMSYWKKVIGL
jgi:hypothetical protein